MCGSRILVVATAALACAHASAQDATPTASPAHLTLSGHFEVSLGLPVESATKSIAEQIDVKRAADDAHSQFSPIWDLSFWRYLPADPARTLNSRVASDDDPFFTPEYLKVSDRQLDYQLRVSEKATRDFLQR